MVQTKIMLTLEPHDLKIINDGLLLLVTHLEDCYENPGEHVQPTFDNRQIEMFQNDAKLRANEARSIINAIN